MFKLVNDILYNFFQRIVEFLPNFFGGLLILLIGLVLSSILKRILLSLFTFFKLAVLLQKMRLMGKNEVKVWEEVLAEILRWTVVIIFLIPTLETWGLSRATSVINSFLFYLPNVIIAVVIGFVGIIAANLISDVVKTSIETLGEKSARSLSMFAKWVIIFFTVLIVMNQLGVAQDLIRILFTGIVAMLTIAGGIAFGLGGKDLAKDLLEEVKKKMK